MGLSGVFLQVFRPVLLSLAVEQVAERVRRRVVVLRGGVGFSAGPSPPSNSSLSPERSDALLATDDEESYGIATVCFDKDGIELAPVGVALAFNTGCALPTFGIVKPAVTNTRVEVQDMHEVGVTMNAWEYRQKWYGEDEKAAKARARELKGTDGSGASNPGN